jgi:hypothetical protein
MIRRIWFCGVLTTVLVAGCSTDIVCTKRLKEIEPKCVAIAPIESEDPQVGKVIRDIIEKEFVRKHVALCDPNDATIFLSGSAFLTTRGISNQNWFGGSSESTQAIESVSLVAKDRDGQILLSASYDNKDGATASKLAKDFGSAIADKLK